MAIMEAIATQYLEADAASITFSSIPATYEHLEIRLSARTNRTYYIDPINIAINTDSSSSNFTVAIIQANGTSKSAYSSPTSLFMITQIRVKTRRSNTCQVHRILRSIYISEP